MVLMFEFPMSD